MNIIAKFRLEIIAAGNRTQAILPVNIELSDDKLMEMIHAEVVKSMPHVTQDQIHIDQSNVELMIGDSNDR